MLEKNFIEEVWKQIEGYPNYEVSNMGRVRSLNYHREKRVQILNRVIHPNGYDRITLCKDGKKKLAQVHRLVWEAFMGKIPEGYEIDHINTVRDDNRLENLRCVTHKENQNNETTKKRQVIIQNRLAQNPEWRRKNKEAMEKLAQSPEWQKNHAEAMKKLHSDPEYRSNHAEAMKKLSQNPEWRKNNKESNIKKWSDPEFRKKILEGYRKAHGRPVYQLDKKTGEIIRKWDCIADVEKALGIHDQNIHKVCQGKRHSAGGFAWKFVS